MTRIERIKQALANYLNRWVTGASQEGASQTEAASTSSPAIGPEHRQEESGITEVIRIA